MNKLDMNLFAFVAWLEQNRHAHSEDRLTINDGYEWYNYMWTIWLKNSDAGREIMNGGINNIPDNTDENITTDKNTNHPMWTSTTTWDNLDTNHSLNLDALRDKLDNMLSKETTDSLNEWLNNKRDMSDEQIARVELMGVLDDVQSIMHELTLDELDVLIDEIKCVYERFSDITDARKNVKPE
jgi:hypothetical protein